MSADEHLGQQFLDLGDERSTGSKKRRRVPTDDRFWNENPNQMSLPSMEEHGHPGAGLLSRGYVFDHTHDKKRHVHMLEVDRVGRRGEVPLSGMSWNGHEDLDGVFGPVPQGQIQWVGTEDDHKGQGLAGTLYGVARKLAKVRPEHSHELTEWGEVFAHGSSRRHGGVVPVDSMGGPVVVTSYKDAYDNPGFTGTDYGDPYASYRAGAKRRGWGRP
jgi:hypothetical protein